MCVCVCVCVCIPSAALEYLKSHPVGEVDEEEFSHYCGVGVLVTPQQIHDQVCTLLTLACAHAQRGLLQLVFLSVCVCVCLSVHRFSR